MNAEMVVAFPRQKERSGIYGKMRNATRKAVAVMAKRVMN